MKIIKYLFVLILIVSLASCKSDDDTDTPYLLTNENFAGIYNLNYLLANVETTGIIGGVPFTVPSTSEGSVFQVETSFNQNETYSLVGQFLLTTNVVGSGTTQEIIVLDENGTFQLNDAAKTITITSTLDLLNGTFDVTLFTENELRMINEKTTVDGSITTESAVEIRFTRD